MSCQKTFVTFAPAATDAPNCQALFWNVVPPYPPEQALIYHQSPLEQSNWRVVKYVLKILVVNDTYMSTSRALMEGINMEKSSQGCYKAMQLSQ